jgi:hypothetical protein
MHDGATREFDPTAKRVKGRFKGRQRLANQCRESTETEGYASLYRSVLSRVGRRSAAARAGVSDCAGFAPN